MRYLQLDWTGPSGVGRYLLTLATVIVATVISGVFIGVLMGLLGAEVDPEVASGASSASTISPEALGLGQLAFFGIALLPFVVIFFALWGCLRVLHQRPLWTLITPAQRIDWARIGYAGAVWGGLMLLTTVATALASPGEYELVVEPAAFAQLLGLALLLIPIQASTEELLLRGYLMQGVARWLRSGTAAVVVTSILFGLLHGANTEVAVHGLWLTMPYYIGFGALLALLTLVDNRLEMALGIHIVNNLVGTVLVTSPESSLPTPALLRAETASLSAGSLLVWFLTAAVFVGVMARQYEWTWNDLHDALGRVEPPTNGPSSSDAKVVSSTNASAQDDRRLGAPNDVSESSVHPTGD